MKGVDLRRVLVYLTFAFGISWTAALAISLTGGLAGSLQIILGTPLTLAFVLLPTFYMFAPAAAHVLTRLATREGWQGLNLQPQLRRGWRYWVFAWISPIILILAGTALYFALFSGHFDPSAEVFRSQVPGEAPVPPALLLAGQLVASVSIGPVINCIFTFGEEFGWRAYLLPKLTPLGFRRAMVATGAIWGVWHWPLILMGYNYGMSYPGYPWLGPLAMLWFTLTTGVLLGWLALRGGSVWPAVIGHAVINACSGVGILFLAGNANPVLGPSAVGVIGGLGFAVVAAVLLIRGDPSPRGEAPDPT